jgi:hypothetical protein
VLRRPLARRLEAEAVVVGKEQALLRTRADTRTGSAAAPPPAT